MNTARQVRAVMQRLSRLKGRTGRRRAALCHDTSHLIIYIRLAVCHTHKQRSALTPPAAGVRAAGTHMGRIRQSAKITLIFRNKKSFCPFVCTSLSKRRHTTEKGEPRRCRKWHFATKKCLFEEAKVALSEWQRGSLHNVGRHRVLGMAASHAAQRHTARRA